MRARAVARTTHAGGIGNLNLLVFFGLLVPVLVLAGTPIAFSFGIATMTYLAIMTDVPLTIVVSRMDEGMSSWCCWRCRCSCFSAC